jgi:hypothetical protein
VAAAALLAVVFASGAFIVSRADHAHTHIGSDCPVCHQMAACGTLLECVGLAAAGFAAFRAATKRSHRAPRLLLAPRAAFIPRRVALFSDAIRFNN